MMARLVCSGALMVTACASPASPAQRPATAEPAAETGATASPSPARPSPAPQRASRFRLPLDLSAWRQWTKANSDSFVSGSHRRALVDIYIDPAHVEAYRSHRGPMPVGLAAVLAQHRNEGGSKGAPLRIAAMLKMPAGFDPEHGDWYYGVYSYDGKHVLSEGKSDGATELCATCHSSADADYLFGGDTRRQAGNAD